MKRLWLASIVGCLLIDPVYVIATQSNTPKKWTIEDFIEIKCYEVDERDAQHQCIRVKQFLLQARKAELENKNLKFEGAIISVGVALVGLMVGGIIALGSDNKISPYWGPLVGLLGAPIHIKRVKDELHRKIPASLGYYKRCLQNPHIYTKLPHKELDTREYAPKLSQEEKSRVAQQIAKTWDAEAA
jgi:hypothetical protein